MKTINIKPLASLMGVMLFIHFSLAAFAANNSSDSKLVVQTKQGQLKGYRADSISIWKGIRYAKAPVGALRFKAPLAVEHWDGVKDALQFGPTAIQFRGPIFENEPESEDCLFLNIWSPAADGKKRPVMVWIHGGGFIGGSGSSPNYEASKLAAKGDVVVVTINYRLGVYGFLYFDPTNAKGEFDNNLGLKDQVAALQWVKDNIAAFGGDPNQVTIFGESAGAISVQTLMALPAAKGLFKRAIVQSGNQEILWSKENAKSVTEMFLKKVGVSTNDLGKLKTIPADTLNAQMAALMKELFKIPRIMKLFAPTIDGDYLPTDVLTSIKNGNAKGIDVLIGTNHDESNLFASKKLNLAPTTTEKLAPYMASVDTTKKYRVLRAYEPLQYPHKEGILALITDATFTMPCIQFAEAQSTQGNTYMYRFDYATPALRVSGLKACHGIEIPYVFGNFDRGIGKKILLLGGKKQALSISNTIQQAWINFARTGNPNSTGVSDWKLYDVQNRNTHIFNKQITNISDPRGEQRKAWIGVDILH